ncbi:uncharacterized protein LOC110661262 isoform X1 [Hevea brasiliensis]|uniref:uncharacterized protein LOC110661262 isoform X1 n=1 Tax=Hevea brasiliensis TaxID=3981 RepID=UPI0025D6D87B|nr:uncharacterized protein LOC110661262 isoform X1 [Hevea brasiliensis]
MLAEPAFLSRAACTCLKWQSSTRNTNKSHAKLLVYSRIRPSHSMDDENKVYKQPVSTFAGRLVPEKAKEVEGINYQLFKQACRASLDVNKFLDQYEMVKLLKGP